MGIEGFLAELAGEESLVHQGLIPARAASFGAADGDIAGHRRLWAHQAEAIDLVRRRQSVVLATGTASGKSLCFQLPVADAAGQGATTLCLYPTKALAHDQLRAFGALALPHVVATTYDGDTDDEARSWARRHANVVLTNPEMLHIGLLPHHGRWAEFLARLRYVVVDELHVYRGIFGSHVSHLLRRLRRVCAHYGADPAFVFTSATIGDPGVLAGDLCGLEVTAVDQDASPRAERHVLFWNPPLLDPESGRRASAHGETAALLARLMRHGVRTIAFTRSRRATELVAAEASRLLGGAGGDGQPASPTTVRAYRGGYLAEERRAIEADLADGRLGGVVATSALELGVDIGNLDACIIDGFPGTVASFRQQIGRAGRGTRASLAILVAGADQLDQWVMAHPRELLARPPEPAVINPDNTDVALAQLACAAYELPIDTDDRQWWPNIENRTDTLVADGILVTRAGRSYWAGAGAPAPGVGLRSGSANEFVIAEPNGQVIGTVDGARAFGYVHPGAEYLHQGQAWTVTELDVDDRVAWVERSDGSVTTEARRDHAFTIVSVDERTDQAEVGFASHLGMVEVREQVVGYRSRSRDTGAVIGTFPLAMPPTTLVTRGFWWTILPAELEAAGLDPDRWPGSLHALEHAAISMLPLFTICDRSDVGGVSTVAHPDTDAPTILVYDGYPGGAGIAEMGFAAAPEILAAAGETIAACPCRRGCPSCVQSPKCGNLNDPLDKAGATDLVVIA